MQLDGLQKYKVHRIMKFLGGCPPIKLIKIIADMKWIHYDYLRRFIIVKPKNQKEVNHENLSSCKNLDRLSRYQFLKNNLELDFQNPCDLPMLRKLFRPTVTVCLNIIEKETVDEIIFRTTNDRIFPISYEAARIMVLKAGNVA